MVTHFQLPPYEYLWATRQVRDIAINVNSLGTWFFSKEWLCGQYRTPFRNYPVQNRGERGWLPTCGISSYRETITSKEEQAFYCRRKGLHRRAFLLKASHCHTESRRAKREESEEVIVVVLADREGLAEKPRPTTLNKRGILNNSYLRSCQCSPWLPGRYHCTSGEFLN